MLKDLLYLGLGSAVLLKDKVESELNELKEKGKISQEDIKQIIQNAKEKGKNEEDKLKSIIKEALKDVIDELDLATKEDIQKLEKKFEK
jgi:polyhydroxyalkanoate synthesis regulator phasin